MDYRTYAKALKTAIFQHPDPSSSTTPNQTSEIAASLDKPVATTSENVPPKRIQAARNTKPSVETQAPPFFQQLCENLQETTSKLREHELLLKNLRSSIKAQQEIIEQLEL